MYKSTSYQKSKREIQTRQRGGMPAWLYIVMSFVVPVYGYIYYIVANGKDSGRARVAIFFAILGTAVWLVLKMIVWAR